ncbi:protein Loquacious-like isoform X3 [Rhodnius prolixus]
MDKTPVTLLQELLVKQQQLPAYSLILNGTGTHQPIFKFEVSASGETAIGTGKSKKEAKHEAARLLLEKLRHGNDVKNDDIIDININSPYAEVVKDNAVGMLTEYCGERNLKSPVYDLIRDEGLPHAKLFSYKCSVSSITTEAQARTKKQAKQLAAQEMLNKLKECLQGIANSPHNKVGTDFEESNQVVLKKLVEIRNKTGTSSEQLGIKISDYYKIFLDEAYPKSKLLQSFKEKDRAWFEEQLDPEDICKTIFTELNFHYEIEQLETKQNIVAVSLTILGTPTWAFFGSGSTYDNAAKEVFTEALTFMAEMAN